MKTYEVQIEKMKWITDRKGYVDAYLFFEKSEAVIKEEIPPYLICRAKYYQDQRLGIGCNLTLEVKDSIPKILKNSEATVETVPSHCPACHMPLEWDQDRIICLNFDCVANEKMHVYRFFRLAGISELYLCSFVKNWLSHFPTVGRSTVPINGIWDFLIHFETAMPIGQGRKNQIEKIFGVEHSLIYLDIEKKIERKLTLGITFRDFWYIFFPEFTSQDFDTLEDIDPLCSTLQRIEQTGLPQKKIEALVESQDHWIGIAQFWKARYLIIPNQRKES